MTNKQEARNELGLRAASNTALAKNLRKTAPKEKRLDDHPVHRHGEDIVEAAFESHDKNQKGQSGDAPYET